MDNILNQQQTADFDVSKLLNNVEIETRLWQAITVENGYELACEIALGNILMAYGVEKFGDYNPIPDSKLGLWICKNNLNTNEVANKNKLKLSSKIQISNKSFHNIYDLLDQYYIVDNYKKALQMLPKLTTNEKIITKDGHLLSNDYVIFNAVHKQDNILEHKNKLESLKLEQANLELKLSDLSQNLVVINSVLNCMNAGLNCHKCSSKLY